MSKDPDKQPLGPPRPGDHSAETVDIALSRAAEFHRQGQLEDALASYDRALALNPGLAETWYNCGNVLRALGRQQEALASYDQALALRPLFPEALNNRGNTLQSLDRPAEALASYDAALALRPAHAATLHSRGAALQKLQRPEEALASFDQALSLRPDFAEAANNRGIALQDLGRTEDARTSFERALAIKPDFAEALNNLGNTLKKLQRNDEALASYARALTVRPDFGQAASNHGLLLHALARYDEALISFRRALAIDPDQRYLFGQWLHTKMKVCDWRELDEAFETLAAGIAAGKLIASPFYILATPLPLPLQRRCAEMVVEAEYPPRTLPQIRGNAAGHGRIRLGYFSGDFRDQVVAYLTAGLFEMHDRSRFELTAVSFGSPAEGPIRSRIKAGFDQFIDVGKRSDTDVALMARELEIDIAVDLTGFTGHPRTGVFARRAAPVQINFLGYPGTMGAGYMDYLIADPTVIPQEHFKYYAEKIAHLPHTYLVNDSRRATAERAFTRQEMGLPDQGFVFCNVSPCVKITPDDFDIWMQLLTAVDGSVLWLAGTNRTAEANLRREAGARGVSPDRLIFKGHTALMSDHLAQLQLADLFVDTCHFNAHTTANDALWAGLPVLTRLGETFAGRVAASLLKAVGLPELITHTSEAYEALALNLATDPQKLSVLRQRLAENRLTYPLFDTALFTSHIEAAYTTMWERHQVGLPPEHIVMRP